MTPDGDVIDTWESPNTLCGAGLNYLVAAIAYAGVQDIYADIGATVSTITPIYGAIGGPTTNTTVATNTTNTTQTITPVSGTFPAIAVGSVVTGTGIPVGTTVSAYASSSITISAAATATGTPNLVFAPPAPLAISSSVFANSTVVTQAGDPPAAVVQSSLTYGNTTITSVDGTYNYASVTSGMLAISPSLPAGTTVVSATSTSAVLSNSPIESVYEYVTFLPVAMPGGLTANPYAGVGIGWAASAADFQTSTGYQATIGGASHTGTTVTYTVTSCPFSVGQYVTVSDINESGSTGSLNISGFVTATTTTSFTLKNTTTNSWVSGGVAINDYAYVSYIDQSAARYAVLSEAATNTSTAESVIFSPAVPGTSDTALYNELPTGTGRATAEAAAGSAASSNSLASFLWQFQFPLNSTGLDQVVSEAGVFLVADSGAGDGVMLNHALINPSAVWSNGTMLMLTVTIGLEP
jgi:hypothetical protein